MKSGTIEIPEEPLDRRTLRRRIRQGCALDAWWRQQEGLFTELHNQMQSLTARESQTLALIAAGAPNKTIAARLRITQRAVEMRRARIMKKFNVRSLAELLDRVVTYRLLAELREVTHPAGDPAAHR